MKLQEKPWNEIPDFYREHLEHLIDLTWGITDDFNPILEAFELGILYQEEIEKKEKKKTHHGKYQL